MIKYVLLLLMHCTGNFINTPYTPPVQMCHVRRYSQIIIIKISRYNGRQVHRTHWVQEALTLKTKLTNRTNNKNKANKKQKQKVALAIIAP